MNYEIPHSQITDNPWQTRTEYSEEDIESLADDIRRNRLLHRPIVRIVEADGKIIDYKDASEGYIDSVAAHIDETGMPFKAQVACGHTRLRALRYLHKKHAWPSLIPVDLRALTDEEMQAIAWSENAQRKDITAYEEALAIQRRLKDFDWTHEQAGAKLGMARATVSNKLRLLDLPEHVTSALMSGYISERQAIALLPAFLADPDIIAISKLKKWMSSPEQLFEAAMQGQPAEAIRSDWKRTVNWIEHEKNQPDASAAGDDQDVSDEEFEQEAEERREEVGQAVNRWLNTPLVEETYDEAVDVIVNRLVPPGEHQAERIAKYISETPALAPYFEGEFWQDNLQRLLLGESEPGQYAALGETLIIVVAGLLMAGDLDMYREYGVRPRATTCTVLEIMGAEDVYAQTSEGEQE